jgi:hypothetical protein
MVYQWKKKVTGDPPISMKMGKDSSLRPAYGPAAPAMAPAGPAPTGPGTGASRAPSRGFSSFARCWPDARPGFRRTVRHVVQQRRPWRRLARRRPALALVPAGHHPGGIPPRPVPARRPTRFPPDGPVCGPVAPAAAPDGPVPGPARRPPRRNAELDKSQRLDFKWSYKYPFT